MPLPAGSAGAVSSTTDNLEVLPEGDFAAGRATIVDDLEVLDAPLAATQSAADDADFCQVVAPGPGPSFPQGAPYPPPQVAPYSQAPGYPPVPGPYGMGQYGAGMGAAPAGMPAAYGQPAPYGGEPVYGAPTYGAPTNEAASNQADPEQNSNRFVLWFAGIGGAFSIVIAIAMFTSAWMDSRRGGPGLAVADGPPSESAQSEPAKSEPVNSEPVNSEPVNSEPAKSETNSADSFPGPNEGPKSPAPSQPAPATTSPQNPSPPASGPSPTGPGARGRGPTATGPSVGGPSMAGPSMGGPMMGGSPAGGPSMTGSPPMSAPGMAGPGMAGSTMGGPMMGGPGPMSTMGGGSMSGPRGPSRGSWAGPTPLPSVPELYEKKCSNCNRTVPNHITAGGRCPHCHCYFSYDETNGSRSSGGGVQSIAGIVLTFLGAVAIGVAKGFRFIRWFGDD